jgi:arylsulfatase A-like enzyme
MRDAFYKAGLYGPWKAILRRNFLFHHDYHVYRFLTHAPFMIVAPGQGEPRRIDAAMSTVDVLPTLLGLLGMPAALELDGVSFAPVIRGEAMAPPQRALYQEVVTDFVLKGRDPSLLRIPLLRALVEDEWKYVDSALDRTIEPELYNLAEDPQETRNLYARQRDSARVHRLRQQLAGIEPSRSAAPAKSAAAKAAAAGGPWH